MNIFVESTSKMNKSVAIAISTVADTVRYRRV